MKEGIAKGYAGGDPTLAADFFVGVANDGEFTVGGTYFIRQNHRQ